MSRKVLVLSVIGAVCLSVLFTGCGPQADLSLKFNPNQVTTYKVITQATKMFKFEQPSLDKVREDQTGTNMEVVFDQQITNVDQKGDAIAQITLKDIKYKAVEKGEVKFDFDSSRDADKKQKFAKLLGQTYKIRITKSGAIQVIDAKDARNAVKGGYDGTVAKGFLRDDTIQKRHEILALPTEKTSVAKGDSWSSVTASPPGMLAPKSYKKTYTLTNVKDQGSAKLAIVDMTAGTSDTPAEDLPKDTSGMGPFAKMFDTEETYTGQMTLDTQTGKVLTYNEKLDVKYIAAETSAEQKSDKGPDTLTMGFIYAVDMEVVN